MKHRRHHLLRIIFGFCLAVLFLPLHVFALHRSVECKDYSKDVYLRCQVHQRRLSPKKRLLLQERCRKVEKAELQACNEKVKNDGMLDDCSIIPTPYALGPALKKPNSKFTGCVSNYIDKLEQFRASIYKNNAKKRSEAINAWSEENYPELVNCLEKNKPNKNAYSPLLMRPAHLRMGLWEYFENQPVGTRGYLCLGAQPGHGPRWVSARIRKIRGDKILVEYNGGRKLVTWKQFLPLKNVILHYPYHEQLDEKSIRDAVGKIVAEYLNARATAYKYNKPLDFKPTPSKIISKIKATKDSLSFYLELYQFDDGGAGTLVFKPKGKNYVVNKNIMLSNSKALWSYYPEKLNCTITNNQGLKKSDLPEICQ